MSEEMLLTDLYQLAMMAAYRRYGMNRIAVFELFVRKLPEQRGFLVAAGLEQAVAFLEDLRFSTEELDYLRSTRRFEEGFVDALAGFRFTGGVDAMPEGTVFFPDEPILRVVAPLPEAQFVETRLLNLIHFQTIVASKAARMVLAAPGKLLVDFGMRRAHGAEAGVLAARAAYLAGFAGTATVLAGARFGIPLFGTMAHSFIQAHDDESLAFERFARARPEGLTLLIDTYDTERGARRAAEVAHRLAADGIVLDSVRIDSGDLAAHARAVRAILDDSGLRRTKIFASGGLDETHLLRFEHEKAPIDGYGIGTSLTTVSDAPALDCAYKLQEYAGSPRRKRSEGKATWPGRKQVWRSRSEDGRMVCDVVTLDDAHRPGTPLLQPMMRQGKRLATASLVEHRRHAAAELAGLPVGLAHLERSAYPVEIDESVRDLAARCDAAERALA